MKITFSSNSQIERTTINYPWLGMWTGKDAILVVFFTSARCGIVLRTSSDDWKVGEFNDDWDMKQFTDFHGTVTLEQ